MATKKAMLDKIRSNMAAEKGEAPAVKKPRKKRKPMSEEQKAAAAERLAKAREKRLEENPPEYKSVHPDVLAKPEEDPLSLKNVRTWIKTQKDLLASARSEERAGKSGAIAKVISIEGYIRNMERYIRDGIWLDMFYGEYAQNRMTSVSVVPAYDKDGNIKRNWGTYYPDLGEVWYGDHPPTPMEEIKKRYG